MLSDQLTCIASISSASAFALTRDTSEQRLATVGLVDPAKEAASSCTHRPLSSSFLGLPYKILNINHKKELLTGLWVDLWEPAPPHNMLAGKHLDHEAFGFELHFLPPLKGNYRWGV